MGHEIIRIGIIGAGANTRSRHIPGLQAIDAVEIVGLCNRSRQSSETVAKAFGIRKVYDHWPDVIDDADTNAIVIGTWPDLHCRATLAALAADKHVLCEARMAANARQAHQMLEAAQFRPHLVAQIVPSPFSLHVDDTIKRLIAENYLGRLLAVEVRAGGTFLDLDGPLHWRHDADLSGVNTLSLGIWYEAVIRWVGPATRVTAMGKTFVTMRKDSNGIMRAVRIPEHLDVIAEMAFGGQAHFQISSATGLAGTPEAFIFGTEGTLRFADNTLFGGKRSDSRLQEINIPSHEAGAWRVEEEFVNAIRGREKTKLTTFEDGATYMEFTEAVAQSTATGQTIPLPQIANNQP